MKNLLFILPLIGLTACASITNSKNQPVSVDAVYKGESVEDAQCTLLNDKGTWYVKTPGSVMIQKSYGDLSVTCKKAKLPTGMVSVTSKSNGGVWGNILAGGIIGYAVDASSGAGFDYPGSINVELGRNVVVAPPQAAKPDKTLNQEH